MGKRPTEIAAWKAIKAFDRIEAKFIRATDAYHKAAKGKNVRTIQTRFKTFQMIGGEMIAAYVTMGKACGADHRAYYADLLGRMQ